MSIVRESFLHWLHYQRNHERLSNYRIYDGYYNGDHEVDIPQKVKSALESELGTVNNYCRVAVDTPVDYICGGETSIQVKSDVENQDRASKAEALLYSVYEANQFLYEEMLKTVTIMGKKGDVFLKLYIENNQIKVRALRPDICFPKYQSDDYKKMLYCAVKWFDTEDENETPPSGQGTGERWKAQVFRPDVVEYYELGETAEGG